MKTSIKIENLSKSFNGKKILKEINLRTTKRWYIWNSWKKWSWENNLISYFNGTYNTNVWRNKNF